MALNINRTLLFVSVISSLFLTLSVQADLAPTSSISSPPEAAPAPGPTSGLATPSVPLDALAQVTRFISSTMVAGRVKTETYLKDMEKRIEDPSTSPYTLECLKECQEMYDAAMEDMKNTIDDMTSGDYYKATVDISSVSTNVDTCQECYTEMIGEDPEIKKFDDWVSGITGDMLTKLETVVSK